MQLLFFRLVGCPYCRKAAEWIEELCVEHPEYRAIQIKVVDEEEDKPFSDSYDYYYVPAFFLNGKKLHEGAATKPKIKAILDECLK